MILKKWYGPMIPEENAKQIWFMQIACEKYKLGVSTLKQDPCVLFAQELAWIRKICEEKKSGNAKYANITACEELEIYEAKYKNMPMPPYQRQPSSKPDTE